MAKRIRKVLLNYIPNLIKIGLIYKVPFLYRFLEIQASSCTIMLTHRCNLKCIMCKQWQEPATKELETEDWKKIIKDLKKNGIKNIHFTGGEPLLRKDLAELVSFGFKNGFVMGLTTNGTLLNEEILSDLINAGLRSIAVSIDALNSEYEKIRGVADTFRRVKDAVSLIAEKRRKNRIDAYINFTLMKDNIMPLREVKKFADQVRLPLAICLLDKNSFPFFLKENSGKFWINEKKDFDDLQDTISFLRHEKIKNPRSLIINFPAIDFIEDYFKNPIQKDIPCISSQDKIIIDAYGNLLGGCMSMGSFGSIKEKKMKELTKEDRYKLAKRNMFYKNCAGCSCGYLFNIKLFLPLVIKDIAQRLKFLTLTRENV